MSTAPILAVDGLSVSYGDATAVRNVSFELAPSEVLAIIGRNGAGKSSLISAIAGLRARSGEVVVEGTPLAPLRPAVARRRGISVVLERRELFPGMSVEDNLLLGTPWGPLTTVRAAHRKNHLEPIYAQFPILVERRKQLAGQLSGGEQQMVAIGRALLGQPRVLLLDEPSFGLAPLVVNRIYESVMNLKESGLSMILVEENARRALNVADRAIMLERGEIILEESAVTLRDHPEMLEFAYRTGSSNHIVKGT